MVFELDCETIDFLKSAQLSDDYVSAFTDARMDMNVIYLVDHNNIAEIIKRLGDLIRFCSHLTEVVKAKRIQTSPLFTMHRSTSADTLILDSDSEIDCVPSTSKEFSVTPIRATVNRGSDEEGIEVFDDNKLFLTQNLNASWSTMLDKWRATSNRRLHKIYGLDQRETDGSINDESVLTVHALTMDWPILKDRKACSLFEIDFLNMYGFEQSPFYARWQEYKNNLLNVLLRSVKDKNMVQQLNIVHETSIEGSDSVLLAAFPYLFPPKNVKSQISGKVYRPSSVEIQEGFFSLIKNPAMRELKLHNRRCKLEKYKVPLQPVVIA